MRFALGLVVVLAISACASEADRPAPLKRPVVSAPLIAPPPNGRRVYSPSQCIGAIVNGVCHGTIMPDGSNSLVCHGEMLNGQCTGPIF